MTTAQWRRAKDLFDDVLQLEPAARECFLAESCPGDDELRAHLKQLLRDNELAGDFLEEPLLIAAPDVTDVDESGRMIGRQIDQYRILGEIGRGGMGVVYLAERADDSFHKKVAIKVVWPGFTTQETLWRFKQERRILAKLDHPNIARLLNGGVTEDGWQYVVMEYVAGRPITEFCHQRNLPIAERLELFQQICAAVEYAHNRLIVHRDLKPSNILVTEEGQVKLLDFGIAKLLDPALLELPEDSLDAVRSRTGLQPMTPEYASPEQIRNTQITTASDVYSLGVLLYELLTGQRPYRMKSRLLHEAARVICEEEPSLPSAQVRSAQSQKPGFSQSGFDTKSYLPESKKTNLADSKKLATQLQGDLDNIVLKALRKEPEHRYRSASEFSRDIARHLNGEPVLAREATLSYRATKYFHRHKTGVLLTALMLFVLVGGLIYLLRQSRIDRAKAELQQRLLYAADMRQAGQDWTERNLTRAGSVIERYQSANPELMGKGVYRGFEWYYLWNALNPPHTELQHQSTVGEFVVSSDGKRAYVAAHNGKIEQWNLATHQFEKVFADHPARLRTIALARNGSRLAAGGEKGILNVWEVSTGKQLFQHSIPSAPKIHNASLSPNGKLLAAGGGDGFVYLFDVDAGHPLPQLRYSEKWVQALEFSPDGKVLAAAGTGETQIKLWETHSFQPVTSLTGSQAAFFDVEFSNDGKQLIASTYDGKVLTWELRSQKLIGTLPVHEGMVWAINLSPDGTRLATAGDDNIVRVFDAGNGEELARFPTRYEISTILILPDASQTILFTTGQTTQMYELARFKPPVITVRSDSPVNSLAISPNGRQLALAAGKLLFRSFLTQEQTVSDASPKTAMDWVAFSPDGKMLVAVHRLNPQTSMVTLREALTGQVFLSSGTFPYINSLAIAADGKTIAIGSNDGRISLLDSVALQPRLTIPAHNGNVIRLFFTPDSQRLISHQQGDLTKCWDAHTGRQLFEFESELPGAFSPDGALFATSDSQYNIHLREAATGQTRQTLHGHSGVIWAMVFSPDGKRLASAGDNATIRIWDVNLGAELLALKGHNKRITSLAFTPDGRTLVSAGRDSSFRIWQTANPEETP